MYDKCIHIYVHIWMKKRSFEIVNVFSKIIMKTVALYTCYIYTVYIVLIHGFLKGIGTGNTDPSNESPSVRVTFVLCNVFVSYCKYIIINIVFCYIFYR